MKVYHTLTPNMRKCLKHYLDSGKKTPDEIRHNIMVLNFIEQQDELIPLFEINNNIRHINEKNGTNIPPIPVITKPTVSNIPFEHTMEVEIEYFLKQWEKKKHK